MEAANSSIVKGYDESKISTPHSTANTTSSAKNRKKRRKWRKQSMTVIVSSPKQYFSYITASSVAGLTCNLVLTQNTST